MIRSFTRWAALAFATAALSLSFSIAPAQAASIQLSDSNCDSFTLTGNPPNQVLNCVVSNPPVCTVTGATTAQINNPLTLTASCTPAATSFAWTGGGCASSTNSICTDNQAASGTVTYTVKGTNANGPGPTSPDFDVAWSDTVTKPSNCSIGQVPSGTLPTGGGSVTLTMRCTGGSAATSYSWTGPAAGTTSAVWAGTVTGTTAFSATATNSAGSTTANLTVQVATGGGGSINCAGYNTKVIDMPWAGNAQANSSDSGSFGNADAFVIRFTTGSVTSTGKGELSAYSSDPNPRTGALSATPCNFSVGIPTYKGFGGSAAFIGEPAPKVVFAVDDNIQDAIPGAARLLKNTTYYLNIINTPGSCSSGDCAIQFLMKKATP